MNIDQYSKLTRNIITNIYKSRILYEFTLSTFDNFPNNIKPEVRQNWDLAFDYHLRERKAFINGEKIERRTEKIIIGEKTLHPYFFIQKELGEKAEKKLINVNQEDWLATKINFQNQIIEQNLVYFIGIIEGFMYDSVKLIYEQEESYLKDHKMQIDFAEIIELKDYDVLKKNMIEKALGRKWSQGLISKRFESLRTKFNITLGFKKTLLELFDEADLIRNCVLHNGSKVSKDYYNQFGEKRNLKLMQPINLNQSFLNVIYYLSIDFVKILFIEVSKICYGNKNGSADFYLSGLGPNEFYKDSITSPNNHMFKDLKKIGVL